MSAKNSKKSSKRNPKNLHLTCGIYFSLLNEASNAGIQELVKCYIHLFDSKIDLYSPSLPVKISKLSHCESCPSSLPFPPPADELQSIKAKIRNSDQAFLNEFINTIQPYLVNEEKNKWFVNKIIEIICNDELVDTTQKFFKDYNDVSVPAKTLNQYNKFNFYHFLIGTILFIMEYSKDNKNGSDTFKELFEKGNTNKEGYYLKDKHKNTNFKNTITLVDNDNTTSESVDDNNNQYEENLSPEEAKRKKEYFEAMGKVFQPVVEAIEYYSKPWNWKKTSENNNDEADNSFECNENARKMNNCDVYNGTVGVYHNYTNYYDEDINDCYDIDLCHSRDQCSDLVSYIDNSITFYEKLSFNLIPNITLKLSDIYIKRNFGNKPVEVDEKKAYYDGYVDNCYNDLSPEFNADKLPIKRNECFFDYFCKNQDNYLILANGGAGKSTFLKHTMLKILYNSSNCKMLPVFIDSSQYKTGMLVEKINNAKSKNNLKYKIVLLIDAFDEILNLKKEFKDELNDVIVNENNINFILTSRPDPKLNSILCNFKIKYLHPLTTFQISDFIEHTNSLTNQCLDSKTINDLKTLCQNNYGIMSTPLYLIFVIRYTILQKKVPNKITNIFDTIFDILYHDSKRIDKNLEDRNNNRNLTYDNYKDIISYLSYNLVNVFTRYYNKAKIKDILKKYSQEFNIVFDFEKLLNDLCTTFPLLEEVIDNGDICYKFIFSSIKEYFIANYYLNNIDAFLSDLKNKKFDGLEEYAETYKVIPLLLDLTESIGLDTEKVIIKPILESIIALYPTAEDYIRVNYGEILLCVDLSGAMYNDKEPNISNYQNRPEFYLQDVLLRYYNRKPPELYYNELLHAPHLDLYKIPMGRKKIENIIDNEPANYLADCKKNNFTNNHKAYDKFYIDTMEVFYYKNKLSDLSDVILSPESEFVQEYEFFKRKLDEINKS